MTATAVIYLLWAATVGVAASTTVKALLTEHPLSQKDNSQRRVIRH